MPLGAQLVLMLLFGAAGVHHARHLERKYGRSAWGLPSWAWGVITAISLLLGAILLMVAERALKKQPMAVPALPQQPMGIPVVPQQPAWAYAPDVVAAPAPAPAVPAQVPAGWHPDPSGRHHHRWWDGAAWTSHVATNGVTTSE